MTAVEAEATAARAVDLVRRLVGGELGSAEADRARTVQALVARALTTSGDDVLFMRYLGDPNSAEHRRSLVDGVAERLRADEGFNEAVAAQLRVRAGNSISAGGSITTSGRGIVAGGDVSHSNNKKKVNYGGVLVAVVAVVALFLVGRAVVVNLGGDDEVAVEDVSQTAVGTWRASDGTGTKTFGGNGGQCSGLYYHGGEPLDIGGPMTCAISGKPDERNRYDLQVAQGPNRTTLKIAFDSDDHATVYGPNGEPLVELTRF